MAKLTTTLPLAAAALDPRSGLPLYRQLYESLRAGILDGRLRPGARLPSTRELASTLNVSRNTVMNAFDQLHAESYFEVRVGDGTYVSRHLPDDLLRAEGGRLNAESSGGNHPPLSRWGATAASLSTAPGDYSGRPRPFRTSTPALDAFPYMLWGRLLARRWRNSAKGMLSSRQQALLKAARHELGGLLAVRPSEAGMHLMGLPPEGSDDRAAASRAAALGVEVTPLSSYCIEPPVRGALRLGYTGYTAKQLWRGARRLAAALRGENETGVAESR